MTPRVIREERPYDLASICPPNSRPQVGLFFRCSRWIVHHEPVDNELRLRCKLSRIEEQPDPRILLPDVTHQLSLDTPSIEWKGKRHSLGPHQSRHRFTRGDDLSPRLCLRHRAQS